METETEAIRHLFIDSYSELKATPVPPFRIEFYPYAGLRHTVRVRRGKLLIRISDLLASAPQPIISALLSILLHKLLRRRVPQEHLRQYEGYIRQDQVRSRLRSIRRIRGRKYLCSPAGRVYDLRAVYDGLNQRYFDQQLKVRHLSWSRRKNRTLMGHYDASYDAIVVNRKLDHPCVPRFVIEYVLYHEMLHAHFGESSLPNGQRSVHHPRFRRAEREFPQYQKAREFIHRYLC